MLISMSRNGRKRILTLLTAAAFLLPSAYIAWHWRDMPQLGQLHDDSIYWVTAKSIAQNGEYRIASMPGQPWQTKYPPLLPALLSIVWRVAPGFPGNLPIASLFCWLWVPLWLLSSYYVFRCLRLPRAVALMLCGLPACNAYVAFYGSIPQADLMFSVLWMASAGLVLRGHRNAWMMLLAGLIGGAAYLTKTAAIPLLLAAPVYCALRKQYGSAAAFAAGMGPAVAGWNWWMRAHLTPSLDGLDLYYTDYLGYQLYNVGLRDLPVLIARNLDALISSTGSLLFGFMQRDGAAPNPGTELLLRVIGILAIAGTVRHARKSGLTPYHAFAGCYAVLLVIWHYPPNERFLLPLFPVLLAGLWTEIRNLASAAAGRRRVYLAVIGAGLGVCALRWEAMGWVHLHRMLAGLRELHAQNLTVYDWISRHTSADTGLLSSDDVSLYLYTGRRGLRPIVPTRYFYRDDRLGAQEFVRSVPGLARRHDLAYILAAPRDWRGELLPGALAQESHRILDQDPQVRPVFRSGNYVVYRLEEGGAVNRTLAMPLHSSHAE